MADTLAGRCFVEAGDAPEEEDQCRDDDGYVAGQELFSDLDEHLLSLFLVVVHKNVQLRRQASRQGPPQRFTKACTNESTIRRGLPLMIPSLPSKGERTSRPRDVISHCRIPLS